MACKLSTDHASERRAKMFGASQPAKDSGFGLATLEFASRQPSLLNPTNHKPRCLFAVSL